MLICHFSYILIISFAKKKKKRCIECMNITYKPKANSFMIDTTDDVKKKKSYYWNCKPDAYVCPVCAFIYSFVPLGFAFTGAESVFINTNGDIDSLIKIMETYRVKNEISDDKSGKKKRMYRVFTSEKIDMMKMKPFSLIDSLNLYFQECK